MSTVPYKETKINETVSVFQWRLENGDMGQALQIGTMSWDRLIQASGDFDEGLCPGGFHTPVDVQIMGSNMPDYAEWYCLTDYHEIRYAGSYKIRERPLWIAPSIAWSTYPNSKIDVTITIMVKKTAPKSIKRPAKSK